MHRIGRTARAGNDGHAVSLVSQEEASLLRDIETDDAPGRAVLADAGFRAPAATRRCRRGRRRRRRKPRARQAHPPRHGQPPAASSRAARLDNALDERGCRGRGVPDRVGRDHRAARPPLPRRDPPRARARADRPPPVSRRRPASRSKPTAGSIACAGSVRPPPSATTARPRARVSMAVTHPAARRRHVHDDRRARKMRVRILHQVRRPAEARDHARKPLGRAAVRERLRRARRAQPFRSPTVLPSVMTAAPSASVTSSRRGSAGAARQHRRSPRAAPAHCPRIARAARSCRSETRRPAVPPPPP